jgi:ABC-type dipeptide/oligopeptide/nickel transport system permease subunit
MANRRNSIVVSSSTLALVRVWRIRRVLLLAVPYLLLLLWLFTGGTHMDVRPGEIYEVPAEPEWEKPNAEHWFGTTGNGADLFDLSRHAMATSVSVAVVSVALGIGLALLFTTFYVFDPGEKRFHLLYVMSRGGFVIPSMVVLVILAGASGGSLGVAIFGLILVIAFHLSPVLANWFQEGESGFDVTAGYVLGLSRREIVLNRIFPEVLRRLPGVFASLVPTVVLAEMALSFLGLTGDRLSCGAMIAYGQAMIIEAPWMAIYPGVMASGVVLILSLLGWRVSAALQTGSLPRIL